MKIICSQIDLKNNLSLVSRAVPSRPTHPILSNVLVIADESKNKVTITGFDLSLGIRSTFPATVEVGGVITLPSKFLNDIITRLPEGEIEISCDEDDLEDNPLVSIQCLSSKFQLRGVSGDEYPELPSVSTEEALILPISALSEGLKGSLFAASSDETKQVLTGVHLIRDLDTLEFAATDGHRLVVVKTIEEEKENEENEDTSDSDTEGNIKQNFAVTIPARALRELENMLKTAKDSESITLFVDEGQVVFQLGEQNLTSRKLEGTYPNYNQLIPRQFQRTMVVDRKRVIESLERVSVLADQKNNMVKFSIDEENQQVSLSVEAKELGNAKESLSAQITGDSINIGFNIRYLMEGLKAINTNEIKFSFNEPTQPVIINPLGGLKMTYLIMPVQLKD